MTEGRQILMAMFQGGGNIPLLLPIVTRLVARGHRVRVLDGHTVYAETTFIPGNEILIGTQLLRPYHLEIHFPERTVRLDRVA